MGSRDESRSVLPAAEEDAAPSAGAACGAGAECGDPSCLAVVDVSATLPQAARGAGDVHVEVVGDVDPVTADGARRALLQCLARARRTLVLDVSRASLDGASAGVLDEVRAAAAEHGVALRVVAAGNPDGGGVPSVGAGGNGVLPTAGARPSAR